MPKLQPTTLNLRDITTEQIHTLLIKAKYTTESDAFRFIWSQCRRRHRKCGFDNPDFDKALRSYYRYKHRAKNEETPPSYYSHYTDFIAP